MTAKVKTERAPDHSLVGEIMTMCREWRDLPRQFKAAGAGSWWLIGILALAQLVGFWFGA